MTAEAASPYEVANEADRDRVTDEFNAASDVTLRNKSGTTTAAVGMSTMVGTGDINPLLSKSEQSMNAESFVFVAVSTSPDVTDNGR